MYNQKVLSHFQNPKNAGGMKGADGIGKVGNAACGDIMKIYLKIDENEVVTDAKFKTFGCAAAIASTDVACDLIKGKTLEEAKKITNKQVFDILGDLPAHKIHCSVLAEEAIASAIENYNKKKNKKTNKIDEDDED